MTFRSRMGPPTSAVRRAVSVVLTVAVVAVGGCATIPKEAPELSLELGKRMSAIEKSHLTLLGEFFDQKRRAVDEYVDRVWIAVYSESVMVEPAVANLWTQVCKEGTPRDRLEFLRRIGPKIQLKINAQRQSMITPLDELERAIAAHLRGEYDQARAINGTLTSFLTSAAKVDENRKRYLEMLGIRDEKVGEVIDEIDEAVGSLAHDVRQVDEATAKAEPLREKLTDALAKAKKNFGRN